MSSEFMRTALGPVPAAVNAQVGSAAAAGLSAAPGQDNAPVMLPATKPASKKRKSTEAHTPVAAVDLDSIDLEGSPMDENCDQVRRKFTRVIDSGAMTKTAFAREIGVSAKSLNGFPGTHGPMNWSGFAAYDAAWEFFKKREIVGVKLPTAKKQVSAAGDGSAAAPALPDISDVVLPGEDLDAVPVFDTCDEVRKKINAHLKKPGITKAGFCRDMYAQLKGPSRTAKPLQSSQLDRFRNSKGPLSGAKTLVYYGAYVFFEKLRIKGGRPKSKHRVAMEREWGPEGIDREHDQNQPVWCRAGEHPVMDRYGKLSFRLGLPIYGNHGPVPQYRVNHFAHLIVTSHCTLPISFSAPGRGSMTLKLGTGALRLSIFGWNDPKILLYT
ncbi:hypothetical protein N658DRAFT_560841 [Parathielavia hyrcaniae]|uniref:DUF7726 domain-containing protein n=1 Tax=Parathielavia hyrcaniae TaxID=113614 RepID=A0AAN6Q0K9_9PEZI|nr:hypothetical protein N658DRAFT_560841 [Parathielavia hyrcaniae]